MSCWTSCWLGTTPGEVFRSGRLIDDLKKAVAGRALDAEMDAHPEHEPSSGNPP